MHNRNKAFGDGEVLEAGMQAGLDGTPLESCPYPAGSAARVVWSEGWRCGTDEPDVVADQVKIFG
ncbi:ribosome modulation factor [Enterovirga aerilata]|uniref:Uncharacterized protein n=1 Tax=Enterovirga aerilata TaxID=2730920 RepID=A0A849I7X8_9HYPH|nr:hypothetical protein [Enterovirga sp. DB1703]